MDIKDIKVGMKVRLLGKHRLGDNIDNIEDWYEDCKAWKDVQKIKERGYGVVKHIFVNGNISIQDEDETLFDWSFSPEDLEPYIIEPKFKIGDKVKVKNVEVDTCSSYGGFFVENMVEYIGKIFTISRVNKKPNKDNVYYHLKETDMPWTFAEEWLEFAEPVSSEEELLLPIGTKIRQVKPRLCMADVLEGIFEVVEADNTHVFAKYGQNARVYCSITKQEIEEYWEVVEEKKDKWEDRWRSYGLVQYKVHSNGKKVKVKIASGDVGVAICADSDKFDLEKGIKIAKNRATIKKLEKHIKKLSK